jgi:hypothetical protein
MRKAAKRERKAMRAYHRGKDTSKFERRVERGQRRDEQNTDVLLWVVLLNAEQGQFVVSSLSRCALNGDYNRQHDRETCHRAG